MIGIGTGIQTSSFLPQMGEGGAIASQTSGGEENGIQGSGQQGESFDDLLSLSQGAAPQIVEGESLENGIFQAIPGATAGAPLQDTYKAVFQGAVPQSQTNGSAVVAGNSLGMDLERASGRLLLGSPQESSSQLGRRIALQKFVKKMAEEFGLSPESILQAIGDLSPQQMALPPEKNIQAILQRLPLTDTERGEAAVYFNQMLKETASSNITEIVKSSGRDLSLEVMSQGQNKKRLIERSLDRMSNQFFVDNKTLQQSRNQSAKEEPEGTFAPLLGMGLGGAALAANPEAVESVVSTDLSKGVSLEIPEAASGGKAANFSDSLTSEAPDVIPEVSGGNGSSWGSQISMSTGGELQGGDEVAGWDGGEVDESFKSSSDPSPKVESQEKTADHGSGEAGQEFRHFAESGQSQDPMSVKGELSKAPGTFEVSGRDEAVNAKEVVGRTQMLIEKGGGEMRVELKPEGLGHVTLKVKSSNGKIDVEMITSNDQAKQMLEKSLGDLKANLAAHKLNVDGIKVDVGQNLADQFERQHQNTEREAAQRFLGEFQQQNSGWRRNLYDIPGARSVSSQIDDPAQNSYLRSEAQKRPKASSSRRLDLVA